MPDSAVRLMGRDPAAARDGGDKLYIYIYIEREREIERERDCYYYD